MRSYHGKRQNGQCSPQRMGMVSGFVAKLIRESAGLTQAQLAENLGVDVATVQGWESGRRPLGALRSADLVRLRFRLLRYGAQPTLIPMLDHAIHADLIITAILHSSGRPPQHNEHPLGTLVHQRALSDLITWPLTRIAPIPLRHLAQAPVRRGPVPNELTLTNDERTRFFDYLLVTVQEYPDHPTDHTQLGRRQAIYLLGFDKRTHTVEWLHTEQRRAVGDAGRVNHVTSWLALRSSAIALGYNGDRDPLRTFLHHALATDSQEQANLNYWAYWVGEIDNIQINDRFMNRINPHNWSGVQLLEHLLELIQPEHGHVELNIHTLWALLVTHPTLLSNHPYLAALTANMLDRLADDQNLTIRSRRELSDIAYAIRLAHH